MAIKEFSIRFKAMANIGLLKEIKNTVKSTKINVDELTGSQKRNNIQNKKSESTARGLINQYIGLTAILISATKTYKYFTDTAVQKARGLSGAVEVQQSQILKFGMTMEMLNRNISDMAFRVALKLSPQLNSLAHQFVMLTKDGASPISVMFEYFGRIIITIVESVVVLIRRIGELCTWMGADLVKAILGVIVAWRLLSLAFQLSPIGKVILAITALIFIIEDLYISIKGGKGVFSSLTEKIGVFFGSLLYFIPLLIGGLKLFGVGFLTQGKALIGILKLLGGAFLSLLPAVRAVSLALIANPIGLVITAVSALIAIIYDLYNGLNGGKSYINDFFKTWFNFDIVKFIKNIINAFNKMISTISEKIGNWNIGEKIKNAFTSSIDGIKSAFSGMFKWIGEKAKSIVPDWALSVIGLGGSNEADGNLKNDSSGVVKNAINNNSVSNNSTHNNNIEINIAGGDKEAIKDGVSGGIKSALGIEVAQNFNNGVY